jgi:RNA polymerase sigma-70 factor (ECF subfamily)
MKRNATPENKSIEQRSRLAAWVALEVIPHEASVRAWLSRAGLGRADIDDIIQDSYCAFAALADVEHIERPRSYFFQTARNIVKRGAERRKIVPFVPLVDEDYRDQQPGPERDAGGRIELDKVMVLLSQLPERRRQIFIMRRIDGMTLREIADILSLSENIVEHEVRFGLADVKRAWDETTFQEGEAQAALPRVNRA